MEGTEKSESLLDIIADWKTFSRSGAWNQSEVLIVDVKIDSEEDFKSGIRKLEEQLEHLQKVKSEVDETYMNLLETKLHALSEYTKEDSKREYNRFVERVPAYIGKKK